MGSLGVVVGWLVTLERRLLARPTRRELKENDVKVEDALNKRFDKLEQLLEKQNEASLLHRQLVGDSLADIRTKVAVLRDRAGDDPLCETGSHRRRL